MPIFHFTYHTYRSWREDNPKGYVQRGKPGVQPPSKPLAAHRAMLAEDPPVVFERGQQRAVVGYAQELTGRRGWVPHGIAVTPNHIHLVVEWNDGDDAKHVSDTCKRVLGFLLSQDAGVKGKRWFSKGEDIAELRDAEHYDELTQRYLPRLLDENGVVWIRGRGLLKKGE